jgi:hypothetical protein
VLVRSLCAENSRLRARSSLLALTTVDAVWDTLFGCAFVVVATWRFLGVSGLIQEGFYKLDGKSLLKRTLVYRSSEERLDEDKLDCALSPIRLSQTHQLIIRSVGVLMLMGD